MVTAMQAFEHTAHSIIEKDKQYKTFIRLTRCPAKQSWLLLGQEPRSGANCCRRIANVIAAAAAAAAAAASNAEFPR